jgi:hypothetical protein
MLERALKRAGGTVRAPGADAPPTPPGEPPGPSGSAPP